MDGYDIHYLAGIFEQSGSFYVQGKSSPVIEFQSIREQLVLAVAEIMESTVYERRGPQGDDDWGTNPIYRTRVTGRRARKILQYVKDWMTEERYRQIEEVLNEAWSRA